MDIIIACDALHGIGYKDGLPWPHCKSDMARYTSITKGRPKLVSKKTFNTLPDNISRRDEYVIISRNGLDLATATLMHPDGIIVSGAEVYRCAMASLRIDTIYLTLFDNTYPADTFITLPDLSIFDVVEYTHNSGMHPHAFITLKRKL